MGSMFRISRNLLEPRITTRILSCIHVIIFSVSKVQVSVDAGRVPSAKVCCWERAGSAISALKKQFKGVSKMGTMFPVDSKKGENWLRLDL